MRYKKLLLILLNFIVCSFLFYLIFQNVLTKDTLSLNLPKETFTTETEQTSNISRPKLENKKPLITQHDKPKSSSYETNQLLNEIEKLRDDINHEILKNKEIISTLENFQESKNPTPEIPNLKDLPVTTIQIEKNSLKLEPLNTNDNMEENNSKDIILVKSPETQIHSPQLTTAFPPKLKTYSTSSFYKCCTRELSGPPKMNILFMKLHKCGSSTIQNILMRYGLRHELNFMLPKAFYYISYYEPFTEANLPPEARPPNGRYNILTHHTRYSPAIKQFMYDDTVSVTMLRSSASIFESLYNYFGLNFLFGQTLETFLKDPPQTQPISQNLFPVYHGYNQMSVDLGFEKEKFNQDAAIREFVKFIDQQFDLIMIFEYYDESLVLLANLLSWPLENMVYLPVNSRPKETKYKFSDAERQVLEKLNNVDTILYNHFKKKFETCIEQYGKEQLRKDVQKLRQMNEALKKRCIWKENKNGLFGAISYDNINFMDVECIYSTKLELPFTDELRFRQAQRMMFNNVRPA